METKACYTQRNYFRNLIKSNRNQIVFTMHRLIWNNKWTSVLIQINLKMVDTFWFGFEYNKISKIFLCVWRNLDQTYSCPRDWPNYEPPGTSRALRGCRVFEGFKGGPRGVLNGGACRTSDEILPVCTQKKPKRHVLNNLFNCSKLTHNNFFFVKNVFVEINFAKKKHDKYVNLLWLQYCLTIMCHCWSNKRDLGADRNIFAILLYQTEIRLYLPCTDWFETENGQCPFAVPNQSENGKYNIISVWFNKIPKQILCIQARNRAVNSPDMHFDIHLFFLPAVTVIG